MNNNPIQTINGNIVLINLFILLKFLIKLRNDTSQLYLKSSIFSMVIYIQFPLENICQKLVLNVLI